MLQLLIVEVAKQSHDTIKTKMSNKSDREDINQTSSAKKLQQSGSMKRSISVRVANLVEKDDNSRMHSSHGINRNKNDGSVVVSSKNAFQLFAKLPDDDGQYDEAHRCSHHVPLPCDGDQDTRRWIHARRALAVANG